MLLERIEEESGLPLDLYARLVATYKIMNDSTFQCFACRNNYLNAEGREKRIERDRQFKGCYGPESIIERTMKARNCNREKAIELGGFPVGGIRFLRCPGNYWSDWAEIVIRTWVAWKNGAQSIDCSLSELPARVYDSFRILDGLESERSKEEERSKDGKR